MCRLPELTFGPLRRRTARIGLGCANLVGRTTFRDAARIVETALDLGIRYYDVAPLYGMGTAEEVIGAIVGDSHEVIVATKVGIPRPAFSRRKALLRVLYKPALRSVRPLKTLLLALRKANAREIRGPADAPRKDFSEPSVRRSLEQSLALLKRTKIDVLLAHEPARADLDAEATNAFRTLLKDGLVGCYGAAITEVSDCWGPFGSVWQSGWGQSAHSICSSAPQHVYHGMVRNAAKDHFGRPIVSPSSMLRAALGAAPEALFLVSASTPSQLRDLLCEAC